MAAPSRCIVSVSVPLPLAGTVTESGTVNVTPGCVTAGSYATRYVVIVPEPWFSTTTGLFFFSFSLATTSNEPNDAPTTPAVSPETEMIVFERDALATSIRPAPMRPTEKRLPVRLAPVKRSCDAVLMAGDLSGSGVQLGLSCLSSAIAPATCGAAIDVPLIAVPRKPLFARTDQIDCPGAAISG